jgi:hypothetical protein
VKLLHQPRLAQARLADNQRELALALAGAIPASGENPAMFTFPPL